MIKDELYRLGIPEVFKREDVLVTQENYPSFIPGAIQFYQEFMTENEFQFFSNAIFTASFNGDCYHLYNTSSGHWIPVQKKLEGNLGILGTDDMPWYINNKMVEAIKPYLAQDFSLRLSDLKIPTGCYNVDSIRIKPTVDESFEHWISVGDKLMRQHLKKSRRDMVDTEIVEFSSPANYFNYFQAHCSNWIKGFTPENIDKNLFYYSSLGHTDFTTGVLRLTVPNEPGDIFYFFTTDHKNFLFGDPYLKNEFPRHINSKINTFRIAHAYLLKYCLDKGIKYFECGLMYSSKKFLSSGNMETMCMPYLESIHAQETPHLVLDELVRSSRETNKQIVFAVVGDDGASHALTQNMRECSQDVILIPAKNTQFKLPKDKLPFMFSFRTINNPVYNHLTSKDYLFECDYGLIDESVKQYDDPTSYTRWLHSIKTRQLETNRVFGRQIADKLGIANPKYKVLTPTDYNVDEFEDKVVLKHINQHLVGIYDKQHLPDLKKYADTHHIVEEYLGEPDSEIAYTFAFHDDYVLPLMTMWENNRILPHGNKVGSVATLQRAGIVDDYGLDLWEKLKGLSEVTVGVYGGKIFGWCDVSVMKKDGKYYLLEWMMRMGHSNTCSIFHQMKTPYIELLNALRDKTPGFEVEWHTKYSAGVDLYGVPVMAGTFKDDLIPIKSLVDCVKLPEHVKFNYMYPSLTMTSDEVWSNESSWYGVVTALHDDYQTAIDDAQYWARQYKFPSVMHRENSLSAMEIW